MDGRISGAEAVDTATARLLTTVVDDTLKGIPLGARLPLGDVAAQQWNVARGDLSYPVTTLSADAVASNLETMRVYCERNGVILAPHGKTTMAPQLFERQLQRGAWAITAATMTQAAVMRRFGVQRIIVANEIIDGPSLRWVAREQDADDSFELYCLIDSAEVAERMNAALASAGARRAVRVLIEVGVAGGRCGVRSLNDALDVARAAHAAEHLSLAGVEAYEGLVTGGSSPEDIDALDSFLQLVRAVTVEVESMRLFDEHPIVTAGGSSYFDRVVANLRGIRTADGAEVPLVLRSGCYISHDNGKYEKLSPLAHRAAHDEPLRLRNALTVWGRVLSVPEPGTVIVGVGKRDAAHDLTLPTPRNLHAATGAVVALSESAQTFKLMDQHAFLHVDEEIEVVPGDIISFDMSHPCTAFDKARLIPLIDSDNVVVDAVLTFF